MNQDSYQSMLVTVQAFHDKHDFKNNGGEDLVASKISIWILPKPQLSLTLMPNFLAV
jgi:hypothetical protein